MEDATPIFNLRNDAVKKEPVQVLSYSDVLKNMQAEQQQSLTAAPVAPAPVSPQVPQTVMAPMMMPAFTAPSEEHVSTVTNKPESTTDLTDKTFQNEMLVLLSVYIVVHMKTVQDWIQTKVPNLVNPTTGGMSVFGLLMNGVLVIVLWNLSKKMVTKYLKEL